MCRIIDGSYIPATDYLSDAKRRTEHLSTLKSVSRAYRRSAVRELKLKAKEKNDVSRQSAQEAARGAGGAFGGGHGGSQYSNSFGYLGQRYNPYANIYANVYNSAYVPGGISYIVGAAGITGRADELTDTSLPVEFKAGELTAWRCWHYEQGYLRSMTTGSRWLPGVTMDGDPSKSNEGVHAWKTEALAREYITNSYVPDGYVIGEVELWGDVIEHEGGYRAEHAAIKSIVHVGGGCGDAVNLCKFYGTDPALLQERPPSSYRYTPAVSQTSNYGHWPSDRIDASSGDGIVIGGVTLLIAGAVSYLVHLAGWF